MQTFQRPTASKVLNNNWQNEKQKIIVNGKKSNTLENHSSCYDKGPGSHEIITLLVFFREIESQEASPP